MQSQPTKGKLSVRPYARLLTMIGDQLIRNEKIALFELIKNAYDADANWVQIRFNDFTVDAAKNLAFSDNSSIEIEDDGSGMDLKIIKEAWMNPASPTKFLAKGKGRRTTLRKKRVIQGEKGIGRFAVFKIGSRVELITRSTERGAKEIWVEGDLSAYDEEVIQAKDRQKNGPLFLDEIEYRYEVRPKPREIIGKQIVVEGKKVSRPAHGTILRISKIKSSYDDKKLKDILVDISKLTFLFGGKKIKDFNCEILVNGKPWFEEAVSDEHLRELLEKAPIRITKGHYENETLTFLSNGKPVQKKIEELAPIKEFKDRFLSSKSMRKPSCGPFQFEFYIFDFRRDAPAKYRLDKDDKELLKGHRIYLYRDNIRVYPYGDKSNDWLSLDILRGTSRASFYLSNDQTVGYVGITNEQNPQLKDKTNREGLIEIGAAYDDFVALNQSILGLLLKDFTKYKLVSEEKEAVNVFKEERTNRDIEQLKEHFDAKKDKKGKALFEKFSKLYSTERSYLIQRAEVTEDLAAVGLSVESTSHDLMLMVSRVKATVDALRQAITKTPLSKEYVLENFDKLRGQVGFIEDQIRGIQPLFRSSRRGKKNHRVLEIFRVVQRYYDSLLAENHITLEVQEVGPPLIVKTNEAVLLQAFINLLDNAVYWLSLDSKKGKLIKVVMNGTKLEVLFADNGPGVSGDDEPFIFEPFFSTKGLEGRGLGLYIARQLLERNSFSIEYVGRPKATLPGANFLIDFNVEDDA